MLPTKIKRKKKKVKKKVKNNLQVVKTDSRPLYTGKCWKPGEWSQYLKRQGEKHLLEKQLVNEPQTQVPQMRKRTLGDTTLDIYPYFR
jgi:hypothetical protein